MQTRDGARTTGEKCTGFYLANLHVLVIDSDQGSHPEWESVLSVWLTEERIVQHTAGCSTFLCSTEMFICSIEEHTFLRPRKTNNEKKVKQINAPYISP